MPEQPILSVDEKRWRAQDDAFTLSRAEEIKKDPPRLEAAQTEAKNQAEQKVEEVKSLKKVAGQKGKNINTPRGSSDSQGSIKTVQDNINPGFGSSKRTTNHNVFQKI